MKKKLAVLLCMLLLVSLLVIPAAAENAAAWDGSVDTSWYSKGETEFEISTPAQLAGLSAITNGKADGIKQDNFFGKTIKLMADLDLGGVKAADGTWSGPMWYPIGKGFNRAFAGTFQGNGHKISNLYIDGSKDSALNNNLGLFGCLLEDGLIKSVNVVSGQITSTQRLQPEVGGIVGDNRGVIFACHNGADLYAPQRAGGMAGVSQDSKAVIAQCSNSGKITRTGTDNDGVGGICGVSNGGRLIINCYNTGTIDLTANKYCGASGGVVGHLWMAYHTGYSATVMNCYNAGQILRPDDPEATIPGGVIALRGNEDLITVKNNYFLQTETLNQGVKVGVGVTAMNAAQLQAAAPTLGAAFAADTAGVNGGYPLLNWEKTGVYGQAENEGLAITALQLENGTITARLNKALTYFQPKTTHFTIQATVQPDGGTAAAQELKLLSCTTALAEDGSASIVTLKFEPLALLTVGQHVSATVKILDSAAVTAELEIPVSGRWEDHQADAYAGGDGSAKNPYQIATAKQLARLAYQVNRAGETYEGKYFIQTANIDLAGTDLRSDGMEWIPIGSMIGITYKTFCGNYNGQNYTISNLTATAINGGTGLFGATGQTGTGGEIPAQLINIKLQGVTIRNLSTVNNGSNHNVGGLVGLATATDIRNCHVQDSSIEGYNNVGGLVGHFAGGDSTDPYTISGCSSTATVTGRTAGGLVGQFGNGTATGATQTDKGHVELYDSFSAGEVKSPSRALRYGGLGGLIGSGRQNNIGRVEHCYTLANVTVLPGDNNSAESYAGGLIGDPGVGTGAVIPKDLRLENNVILTTSLSGLTAGTGFHYGRVGGLGKLDPNELAATFQNNYVISTMTLDGQAYTGTSGDDANGTTKTPAELATQATWEALGFDLTGLWTWDAALSRPVLTQKTAQYTIRITEQPQDAIAFADRAAEFYVTANRGMGTLTYTWQYSADGKTWKNFKEKSTKLTVAAKLRMDGNQIRCQIKDEGGTTIYTNTVRLQVQDVDFDAAVAANALYARYQTGFVTTPKAPVSLYSLTGDISDCDVLIRYYDSYDVDAPNGRGMPGWALIDTIAQKGSLTEYIKSGVSVPSTTVNLLQETLDLQSANKNGAFFTKNTTKDGIFSNIIYTLAMDMYYDGGAWGNEKEDGTAGRTAAFNYLLSRLKDDTATDGRYFENLRLCNGKITAPGALRYNAEFVILMARFADDPALGKQALAALQDVLEMLNAQFDKGAMDVSTETTARYGSALVAAINVTNSKSLKANYTARLDAVFDKLENAWAKDGGYAAAANLTERASQSDEAATAAAMMALADMANGKAVLAELSLRVPDESVVASDLGMISLPSTALQDLTLPQAGAQGTQFTWASSNEAVISKDGKVTRPAQDTMVTLTVTGTYGEATQTHDFVITVPALRAAGGDEAYADLQNLSLLPEYIHDVDLPTQGENGSAITWASSNEAVISNDGKVTRPAIGQPDAHLTLTATASYGEASQSRTFEVKVWALVDTTTNEGMVKDAYYRAREYYYTTPVLEGYWNTWAAYAALGEELWERDYIYDTSPNSEAQKGAQILGIVAIGENPYNYNGVNYVKRLQDAGYAGPYAVPVYNMLARDAAGIKMKPDEMASQRASASKSWMGSLWMGPDIGGWACVLTCREIKDSTEYYNQAKRFLDAVSDNMAVNTTGSAALSAGCVVTGLTSYMAEGVTIDGIAGMDATKDEPWVSQNPIKMMYSQLSGGSGTDAFFNTQPTLELCDLYNVKYNGGHVAWVAFGVNKARVEKQVAKANEILANKALYTADSVKAVEAALETVKGISQERLNAKYADYGEEYYTLYDAVRYAKTNESAMAYKAAADAVTAAIDALPAAAEITLESKEDVEAARAAFDKLTESQQGMVTAETTGKLAACEAAIAKLEADAADKAAADAVTEAINALPAADEMTLESKEAVEAARAAFDKLTETQQALVPKEAQEKLAAAEAAIAKLVATEADKAAAGAVTEAINALPAADEITLENKEAVEAARAAFDKLTETQQALVPKEAQEALAAAEAAIAKLEADAADKAAAAKVEESINALPAAADLTLANKEAVEAARAAFDKLTEAQQALVSKEAQDKLAAAEARIAELEKPDEPVELPFTDLTQDWYMDSIRYVYEHELMYGTSDTTFAPDDALTRGMFVTMLYRMEGRPEVTGSTSFTDVAENAYYADAVAWANANGVVYGTSDTTFSPDGKITREQMAAMMRRYADFKKIDTSAKADLSTFADASAVSAWATGDMQWAVASELLYGNNHNQLQPTANATRAQAAAILQRFATKIVK